MADEKYKKLITKLYEKTISKNITWEETPEAGTFLTSFPNYSIEISKSEIPAGPFTDAHITYSLSIYNREGMLIEQVTDEDVIIKNQDGDNITFKLFKETYEVARSMAMGVDKALDDILADLE